MILALAPVAPGRRGGERPWAEREMEGLDLGDARRNRRAVDILGRFSEKPLASIPQASQGWAGAKATYRFMDNDKIDLDALLEPHRRRTAERAREYEVALAIGDTTMLDFTGHPAAQGLGPLSDLEHRGFLLHPTLVTTPARVPLGLIDVRVWTRDEATFAKKDDGRSIDEKESFKWLDSLAAADALQLRLASQGAGTRVVSVFDREGDVFDVFASAEDTACELLVRAKTDRRVDRPEETLWETMEGSPVAGKVGVHLPATQKRTKRDAVLEVRFEELSLLPPRGRKKSEGLLPVTVSVVYAEEIDPPKGEEPVSWMLVTTLPVRSFDDACRILSYYCARWDVELFFRILKSGCEVEERRLETADRLLRCLPFDMIVAWRVLYLTTLGRDTPDLPCTVVFDEYEWKALYLFVYKEEERVPKDTPTIREVTRLVGRLGGHLGRKSDKEPGQTVMWRGLSRLSDISTFFRIMESREEEAETDSDP